MAEFDDRPQHPNGAGLRLQRLHDDLRELRRECRAHRRRKHDVEKRREDQKSLVKDAVLARKHDQEHVARRSPRPADSSIFDSGQRGPWRRSQSTPPVGGTQQAGCAAEVGVAEDIVVPRQAALMPHYTLKRESPGGPGTPPSQPPPGVRKQYGLRVMQEYSDQQRHPNRNPYARVADAEMRPPHITVPSVAATERLSQQALSGGRLPPLASPDLPIAPMRAEQTRFAGRHAALLRSTSPPYLPLPFEPQ